MKKLKKKVITSFKSSGQSLINFNDLEAISRYLTALIRCYSFKKLRKKNVEIFLNFFKILEQSVIKFQLIENIEEKFKGSNLNALNVLGTN